jgi:hypothetical protein
LFFTVGLAPAIAPPGYFVFQHSFTFPDIILALGFVSSGMLLLQERARRDRGRNLSRICSSALLFLGLLDVSFNLQNGIYATWSIDTLLEIAVNVWCIGLASGWLLRLDATLLDEKGGRVAALLPRSPLPHAPPATTPTFQSRSQSPCLISPSLTAV